MCGNMFFFAATLYCECHLTDSTSTLHNDVEDGPDEFDPACRKEANGDRRVQVRPAYGCRDDNASKHHEAKGEAEFYYLKLYGSRQLLPCQ